MRLPRRWLVCSTALAVSCAAPGVARAQPHIYWTWGRVLRSGGHPVVGQIGRANLDGSGADQRFITLRKNVDPHGLAADAHHLYWTASSLPQVGIGRAKLDGSGVSQAFMPPLRTDNGTSPTADLGMTVAAGYIYFTADGPGQIGRANVDGSDVQVQFISDPRIRPVNVVVAGGYIYWTNQGLGTIGRANLDGSDENPSFIAGLGKPDGLTVAGGYIFWGNIDSATESIGRAKLNGTRVRRRFLKHRTALTMAAKGPYIYGTDFDNIWRARIDGSGLRRHFIRLQSQAEGLVIR
jgi:hypothetical protein